MKKFLLLLSVTGLGLFLAGGDCGGTTDTNPCPAGQVSVEGKCVTKAVEESDEEKCASKAKDEPVAGWKWVQVDNTWACLTPEGLCDAQNGTWYTSFCLDENTSIACAQLGETDCGNVTDCTWTPEVGPDAGACSETLETACKDPNVWNADLGDNGECITADRSACLTAKNVWVKNTCMTLCSNVTELSDATACAAVNVIDYKYCKYTAGADDANGTCSIKCTGLEATFGSNKDYCETMGCAWKNGTFGDYCKKPGGCDGKGQTACGHNSSCLWLADLENKCITACLGKTKDECNTNKFCTWHADQISNDPCKPKS